MNPAKKTKEPVAGDSERRAPCGGGLSWGHPLATARQTDDATIVAVRTRISRGVEKFFWTTRENGRNTELSFMRRAQPPFEADCSRCRTACMSDHICCRVSFV